MVRWYQVCRLDEIPEATPVAKAVNGIGVVLLRMDSALTALRDRCPHRFAPLSLGKVVEGVLECPYHGLRFGADGRCVFNPHAGGAIPKLARVDAYQVEVRGEHIFVSLN